jgi:hypothetical protein
MVEEGIVRLLDERGTDLDWDNEFKTDDKGVVQAFPRGPWTLSVMWEYEE